MEEFVRTYIGIPLIKCLLMIFNLIFWISGLAIFWAGIWMRTDMQSYLKISNAYNNTAPYILVAIGSLTLIIATLACSCTVKVQPALLQLYAGLLVLILFVEIALAASVYAYKDRLGKGFEPGLKEELNHYNNTQTQPIDIIQTKLQCCGVNNYKDWFELSPTKDIPSSCCYNPDHCSNFEVDVYQNGCYNKLLEILNNKMSLFVSISSVITFIPLIGVILSCCLAANAKKEQYEQVH